jgi:hypothetical protein
LPLLLCLAACGPLPHPFEHEGIGPPLAASAALVPVVVPPVANAPGLAEAVIAALEREDLVGTLQTGEPRFLQLVGVATDLGHRVRWRLVGADGDVVGTFETPAAASDEVAANVSVLVRKAEGGVTDTWPKVAIGKIVVPPEFDEAGLRRALQEALPRRGMAVVVDGAAFVVNGEIKVHPLGDGRDLVELAWTVFDRQGKSLGVASQSNPVAHATIVAALGTILDPIADGAAEGVWSLVRPAIKQDHGS